MAGRGVQRRLGPAQAARRVAGRSAGICRGVAEHLPRAGHVSPMRAWSGWAVSGRPCRIRSLPKKRRSAAFRVTWWRRGIWRSFSWLVGFVLSAKQVGRHSCLPLQPLALGLTAGCVPDGRSRRILDRHADAPGDAGGGAGRRSGGIGRYPLPTAHQRRCNTFSSRRNGGLGHLQGRRAVGRQTDSVSWQRNTLRHKHLQHPSSHLTRLDPLAGIHIISPPEIGHFSRNNFSPLVLRLGTGRPARCGGPVEQGCCCR